MVGFSDNTAQDLTHDLEQIYQGQEQKTILAIDQVKSAQAELSMLTKEVDHLWMYLLVISKRYNEVVENLEQINEVIKGAVLYVVTITQTLIRYQNDNRSEDIKRYILDKGSNVQEGLRDWIVNMGSRVFAWENELVVKPLERFPEILENANKKSPHFGLEELQGSAITREIPSFLESLEVALGWLHHFYPLIKKMQVDIQEIGRRVSVSSYPLIQEEKIARWQEQNKQLEGLVAYANREGIAKFARKFSLKILSKIKRSTIKFHTVRSLLKSTVHKISELAEELELMDHLSSRVSYGAHEMSSLTNVIKRVNMVPDSLIDRNAKAIKLRKAIQRAKAEVEIVHSKLDSFINLDTKAKEIHRRITKELTSKPVTKSMVEASPILLSVFSTKSDLFTQIDLSIKSISDALLKFEEETKRAQRLI